MAITAGSLGMFSDMLILRTHCRVATSFSFERLQCEICTMRTGLSFL